MKAVGHVTGGVVAAGASLALVSWLQPEWQPEPLAWFALPLTAFLFALAPDLDTKSKPQKYFYRAALAGGLLLAWLEVWKGLALLVLLCFLPLLGRHRGWTHRLWAPLLLFPLGWGLITWAKQGEALAWEQLQTPQAWVIAWPYFLAAALGHASHLVLDSPLARFMAGNPRQR